MGLTVLIYMYMNIFPSFKFFVRTMQFHTFQCVMIGDDIVGDVGGAQNAGMRGVQVRTGKYR